MKIKPQMTVAEAIKLLSPCRHSEPLFAGKTKSEFRHTWSLNDRILARGKEPILGKLTLIRIYATKTRSQTVFTGAKAQKFMDVGEIVPEFPPGANAGGW
jgi:hypothetical protein